METTQMRAYWWEENGKIKVQNCVMGMLGQLHEHTKEDFKRWKKDAEASGIEVIKNERS